MIENKVEPKLRNYTDNTPYLPPLLPNNKLLDDNSSFNSFQKVKTELTYSRIYIYILFFCFIVVWL